MYRPDGRDDGLRPQQIFIWVRNVSVQIRPS